VLEEKQQLEMRLKEMTDENSKLHLINQENQQAVQEVFNLNSQVAQLQSENETLQKLSDYL
jgi:hypothetical protein